jgi:hypothetical protein
MGYACVYADRAAKHVSILSSSSFDPKSVITGSRRYQFTVKASFALLKNLWARGGRHDYVLQERVAGPNVFVDCMSEWPIHNDVGPHQRWSMGVLWDNVVTGRDINVRNRKSMGGGHGWAGANHVVWNGEVGYMQAESPPTAWNYVIGTILIKWGPRGNAIKDSINTPVTPVSLYRAQMNVRHGLHPEATPAAAEFIYAPDNLAAAEAAEQTDIIAVKPIHGGVGGGVGGGGGVTYVTHTDSRTTSQHDWFVAMMGVVSTLCAVAVGTLLYWRRHRTKFRVEKTMMELTEMSSQQQQQSPQQQQQHHHQQQQGHQSPPPPLPHQQQQQQHTQTSPQPHLHPQ